MDSEKNRARFEHLMGQVQRPGREKLLEYIRKSDFYEAPASTKFHLSVPGGLLQHSLNVYDCLCMKIKNPVWAAALGELAMDGQKHESIVIVSLLHDLCKTYFYKQETRNQKTYDPEKVAAAQGWQKKHDAQGDFIWETVPSWGVNDRYPYGHGEKSVMLIESYMRLTGMERLAIRWHMGYSEEGNRAQIGQAFQMYPLVLALHEADQEASAIIEDVAGNRKGNYLDGPMGPAAAFRMPEGQPGNARADGYEEPEDIVDGEQQELPMGAADNGQTG